MYIKLTYILSFCLLFCFQKVDAQEYEFRFYLGANYYQGDLAPNTSSLSFSSGNVSWALLAGTKINDIFKINIKFMLGQLSGTDSNAEDSARKIRNLSFKSPLHEYGVNTEININHFLKGLDKYGINLYYTTGINIFKFNPQALLRDQYGMLELIELQPLGTEGQNLPGHNDRYALTQINIPFGLGVRFHLFDNIEMGMELVPRFTFTDYIDDVSGRYITYQDFIDADMELTARLANRTSEFFGVENPTITTPGAMRGNPDHNDWYFFSGIYLSYNFGSGYRPQKIKSKEELEKKTLDALESIDKEE